MSGHDDRGVIVLGHPRSGTTLLRRLLDAHPALAAPPETHVFSACARFLKSDETAHGVDMGVLAGLAFAGFDDDEVLRRLRGLAFGFLEEYAARQGKRRWVEKTAFDIFHLEEIERLCGDQVCYVGVIRHPLDVAVSCKDFVDAAGMYPEPMHAYLRRHPKPVEAFVRSWADTTRALMALGERRPENCVICRYEDLVEDPAGVVGDILGFIGEAPDAATGALGGREVLGFSDHRSYETEGVRTDSVARWRRLPGPLIAQLAPLVADLMAACGYEPLDAPPAPTREEARRRYLIGLAAGKTGGGKADA